MNDLISVIVPIYNVEMYLERCILSIIRQTYDKLDIILVNDGSKDKSLDIAKEYEVKDTRIKVFSKINGGLSDARNFGLLQATGKYVVFIDSDDFIDSLMIETMYNSIIKTKSDIYICNIKYLYDDNSEGFASGGLFTVSSVKNEPRLISINNSACNKMFLKSMFDDIKFPVGKYYEDLYIIPILLYKAKMISKVDRSFYIYYQRKGSIAHSANEKIFDIYLAIDNCINYVKTHGNEKEIIEELYSMYIIHGLDITTIRIKDFDDKKIRKSYLRKNMNLLKEYYPDYKKDLKLKEFSSKKKFIFSLLNLKLEDLVLKIYDK